MRFFRYRKPSLKSALGLTRAKRKLKKDLGITAAMRPFRAPGNAVRRVKRRSGYYTAKRIARGKAPTPMGCLLPALVALCLSLLAGFLAG